jgi:hypothetical protein
MACASAWGGVHASLTRNLKHGLAPFAPLPTPHVCTVSGHNVEGVKGFVRHGLAGQSRIAKGADGKNTVHLLRKMPAAPIVPERVF